ncbi:tail fiber domain-containing protein [Flavobacterium sp. GT3R68]|uniref:tail fiber domain-containing protein n=1 Tax=Flavobacterium sp. GT3R68 TaxID=2594437 RepID=UPI000F88D836|nr:tail fiber domain-containing protein [Flavobacterium sp. GT3R68]RTY95930.1 tail fiber domain-containing protein [Flavobacterium sp. GSN2]TRW93702.1 tail fiber domain-containing protein [Flavobacterium sp. GT3R68]
MKPTYQLLLCALVFTLTTSSFSQVGIGTTTPNASSILDITSTTAGLLTPRMTTAQKSAIASPATGLLIYQTDGTAGFYYYNGSAWTPFGSTGWALTGNAGTTPASNFLGTIDGQDLVIKTNNAEVIRVLSGGNVGIGTTAPSSKLHVVAAAIAPSTGTQNFESIAIANVTTTAGTNPYQINSNSGCVAADVWKIATTSSNPPCTTCTTNRATIAYGSGTCNQNATLVAGPYTATSTSATVSFSYSYDDYSSDATDSFVATLYNETTSTVVSTLINTSADAISLSYTSAAITVISGNTYSIRFKYTGNGAWGASVDNVSITFATGNGAALKIVDGSQAAGKVLTSDASGNASWAPASPGTVYTFTNGLTETSAAVKLGGTLTGATTIDFNGNNLQMLRSTGKYFQVGQAALPSNYATIQGSTFIDGADSNNTRDVVALFNKGGGSGTTTFLGSIEYITDGITEFQFSDNVCPASDNSVSLGRLGTTSPFNLRWKELVCVNGVIQTSDARLKKDIKKIEYGLNEILKLKPVTFKWKDDFAEKGVPVPEDKKENHIGFIAQDLLQILPEVVTTHSWQKTSEDKPAQYKPVGNYGVNYSEIIPVTVKAIQEQQAQIEELKKTTSELKSVISELKKQNELLLRLMDKK